MLLVVASGDLYVIAGTQTGRSILVLSVCTASQKTFRFVVGPNLAKTWAVFKILLLLKKAKNFQQNGVIFSVMCLAYI